MEFKSKYNINQKVYVIYKGIVRTQALCGKCNGKGRFYLAVGGIVPCPECRFGYLTDERPDQWNIKHVGKIGKIECTKYWKKSHGGRLEIKYMIDSTGIGSGSVWQEENIFKTKKEAQNECNKRNANSDREMVKTL